MNINAINLRPPHLNRLARANERNDVHSHINTHPSHYYCIYGKRMKELNSIEWRENAIYISSPFPSEFFSHFFFFYN